MARRDLWFPERRPPPPPPRRRAETLARELADEITAQFRRDLRIGLTRLYRMLRRDIYRAVYEATGKKPPAKIEEKVEEKEKEEEEKKGFFEDLFKFDINWDDILKYGGAAVAGALAILLITHWDDIYSFFTRAREQGLSEEELKQRLTDLIQQALGKKS